MQLTQAWGDGDGNEVTEQHWGKPQQFPFAQMEQFDTEIEGMWENWFN
jgi:hypothetical protein